MNKGIKHVRALEVKPPMCVSVCKCKKTTLTAWQFHFSCIVAEGVALSYLAGTNPVKDSKCQDRL